MILLLQTVFSVVFGTYIIASQFINTECEGPPDQISIYSEQNETELYLFFSEEWLPPVCGSDPFEVTSGCCLASLDLSLSQGVRSSIYDTIEEIDETIFPKSANGASYCHLTSAGNGLSSGIVAEYFLANDVCKNGVICESSGQLIIFGENDIDCQNEINSTILFPVVHAKNIIGEFDASFRTLVQGGVTIKWTTYIPSAMLVPHFKHIDEYFGMVCAILALAIALYSMLYYIRRHMDGIPNQKKMILIQFLWSLWVFCTIMYWFIVFPNQISWIILETFQNSLFNVNSLVSVLLTVKILVSYLTNLNKISTNLIYALMFAIHFVLAGGNYVSFMLYFETTRIYIHKWHYFYPAWNYFQFIFSTVPPIYMLIRLSQALQQIDNSKFTSAFLKLIISQKVFLCTLCFQILNSFIYAFALYAFWYSDLLMNDRFCLAFSGPLCFVNIVHEIFNIALSRMLKKLLCDIQQYKKKKQKMLDNKSAKLLL